MEQKHFSLLPAAFAVAAALAAGTAQGATVHFDNPSRDFTTDNDELSLATGDSIITAKDIALDGKSISAGLSYAGELGTGSLTIKAGNAQLRSYGQSVSISSTPTSASFTGKIHLTGNLTVTDGLSLSISKNPDNSARIVNKLSLNANSIDIKNSSNALHVSYGVEGSGDVVPGGLVELHASAKSIKLESMNSHALYVDGNSKAASETNGSRVTLEANNMEISGGWGGPNAANIAVRVHQGAELNLIGTGVNPELTITAKHLDSPANTFYEDAAIINYGGKVLVSYGEGSNVKFNGGIVNQPFYNVIYTGNTTVEIGSGSRTELVGVLAASKGPLNFTAKGNIRIESSTIMASRGTLTLDLETERSDETGLLAGLLWSTNEGGSSSADNFGGTINIRLAGKNNHMAAMTQFDRTNPAGTGQINVKLENGSVWDVGYDLGYPTWVNKVTTLTLNKGTLNLPYGNSAGIWGTVRTETFGGAGGTVNFDLVLNSSEEKNDHLLIGKMKEGSHTVHVEAHSGFEPVDMQGYLIRADEWQAGTFTADTNPLEAGVYLYSYTVAHRPGEEEGQTDWYLTFGTYVPPAPDPGPEPDPGPGPKPEPTPQPPLSPSGEAVASLAGMGAQTAMYLAQLSDVRKRLGEVRRGATEGLWASVGGSGDHISGFRGTGFKQDAYRFNFGFDRKVGEWLLGGTLKAMTADQKTRGTQFQGKGDAHSEGFNLYATWTGDNGSYADFVAGLDRYHEKLSTHMLNGLGVSGAYRNIGLGLSAEVGHQFMTKDAWFIEPQAQLSYYRLWGDDFALSNGMRVSQKNFNGLTGRLGLASGKEFRKADGTEAGQLYARLGVKHELMGDQEIHVNGIRFKDGLLGTRFYYGLGAEWLIAKNVKVFGHVERENGSRYTREFDFNLGVKYAF